MEKNLEYICVYVYLNHFAVYLKLIKYCKTAVLKRIKEIHVLKNILQEYIQIKGFSGGSAGKESACNAGDPGSISGSGRSPGEGNG